MLLRIQKKEKNQQQGGADHHKAVRQIKDWKMDGFDINKIDYFGPKNPVNQVPHAAGNNQNATERYNLCCRNFPTVVPPAG